jgi:TonB family protein
MIWIALAAALAQSATPPTPPAKSDVRTLFRADDYPQGAFIRGEQGAVIARLVVNPDGRTESCEVVFSSKSSELDLTTCKILRARAKFPPARDKDGSPVYSVVVTPPISWWFSDNPGFGPPFKVVRQPDVELQINKAPEGVSMPLTVAVKYEVKSDGSLAWCSAGSGAPRELATVACYPSNLPIEILKNLAGQRVNAVFDASVRFVLDKP